MKLENYEAFPTELFVLKQKNIIYPFMIVPIFLNSKKEIEAVKKAHSEGKLIFISTKIENQIIGTIGSILREVALPDGKVKILFQGIAKGKILEINSDNTATIELIKTPDYNKLEISALIDTLKDYFIGKEDK